MCAGNPLEEKHSADGDWREQALKRLPKLKKLDGEWPQKQVRLPLSTALALLDFSS